LVWAAHRRRPSPAPRSQPLCVLSDGRRGSSPAQGPRVVCTPAAAARIQQSSPPTAHTAGRTHCLQRSKRQLHCHKLGHSPPEACTALQGSCHRVCTSHNPIVRRPVRPSLQTAEARSRWDSQQRTQGARQLRGPAGAQARTLRQGGRRLPQRWGLQGAAQEHGRMQWCCHSEPRTYPLHVSGPPRRQAALSDVCLRPHLRTPRCAHGQAKGARALPSEACLSTAAHGPSHAGAPPNVAPESTLL